MLCRLPFAVNVLLTLCLAVVAALGDFLVNCTTVHMHKALCDNGTHAAIAAISWLIVCIYVKYKNVNQLCIEVIACAIIASAIDLDHFLIAHSMSLKAAVNLKNRPPLHCTTVPAVFCTSLYLLGSLLQIQWLHKASLLILTAFLSHHIRDANRRGIWLYPFGSTSSIPKWMYITLTCLLPHVMCLLISDSKHIERLDLSNKEYIV